MNELLLLCYEFCKTGLFAIGGGLATIPFLARMPENYPHWFSLETLADMIAVSESTPGPLGVNMSTYVGYTVAGAAGAFAATFSLVLPSFVAMLLIAPALENFRDNRFVSAVFAGLRPATTGLIAAAGLDVLRMAVYSNGAIHVAPFVLFLILFCCTQLKALQNIHPIAYICVSAGIGVALSL